MLKISKYGRMNVEGMVKMTEEERIIKAIEQAAASIWIDNLPLSKEYVEEYKKKRLAELKNKNKGPRLVLMRKDEKNERNV